MLSSKTIRNNRINFSKHSPNTILKTENISVPKQAGFHNILPVLVLKYEILKKAEKICRKQDFSAFFYYYRLFSIFKRFRILLKKCTGTGKIMLCW